MKQVVRVRVDDLPEKELNVVWSSTPDTPPKGYELIIYGVDADNIKHTLLTARSEA